MKNLIIILIKGKRTKYFLIAAIFLMLCSCDNRPEEEQNNQNGGGPDIEIKLNEESAIQKVKNVIRTSNRPSKLNLHYWDQERHRVPCTQYDIGCQDVELYPPYGRKWKTESVRRCCRPREISLMSIYDRPGTWTADYSTSSDSWNISFEFSYEDLRHKLQWKVTDNDGNVSEVNQVL